MEDKKYLRVTDIIKRLMPTMPPEVEIMAKAKGEIGTCVHKLIEDHLAGRPVFYSQDSREEAFFQSWLAWYTKDKPEIIMQEQRMYCDDLMITGQIDAVMSFKGMPVLVDYKTSSAEGKLADGNSSWAMQAHFYYYLLQRNGVQVSDKMIFLQLRDCKEIFLVADAIQERITATELRKMLSEFSEEDRAIIDNTLKTVGEFDFEVFAGKRKIIVKYTPKIAKVFEYSYDKNIALRCVDEAVKAWEEIK